MSHEFHSKRKYELKKRAEEMAETRRRITEAAVELHETVGPARTTLSAVAERAGVQRHTVYRHFPSEESLLEACSAQYLMAHPLPSLKAWRAVGDPNERLTRALDELYAYYEHNAPMFSNVLRDAELVDAVRPTLVPFEGFLTEAAEILAVGRPARGPRRRVLVAALRHAIAFHTWLSLAGDTGVGRTEAIELVTAFVEAAAAPRRRAAA